MKEKGRATRTEDTRENGKRNQYAGIGYEHHVISQVAPAVQALESVPRLLELDLKEADLVAAGVKIQFPRCEEARGLVGRHREVVAQVQIQDSLPLGCVGTKDEGELEPREQLQGHVRARSETYSAVKLDHAEEDAFATDDLDLLCESIDQVPRSRRVARTTPAGSWRSRSPRTESSPRSFDIVSLLLARESRVSRPDSQVR
eukprot:763616-Hanusia_phi.AAC.6